MKLLLGPENLQTELNFTLFKKMGPFYIVNNTLAARVDRIGVYVSGGLDSTALLCLILTELKNTGKLHEIEVVCFTIAKSDGPTYYATQVIEQVEKHFNVKLTHINNIKNDPIPDLSGNIGPSPIKEIREYDPRNMIVYMGINRMAPPELKTYVHPLKINYGYQTQGYTFNSPFLFMHKPQILDIYYKLGCEHIIPYTHTCTRFEVGQCNDCYSCEERAWGFEMLGKTDLSDPKVIAVNSNV
jgi:7-cyano-7-deazaguanine synthase in queuosine biosynthesis